MLKPKKKSLTQRRRLITLYFTLAAVQALAAITWLVRIPADPKNAILFGLSAERLALLAGPVVLLGFSSVLLFVIRRNSPQYLRAQKKFSRRMLDSRLWGWAVLGALLAGLLCAIFILIAVKGTPFVLAPRGALPELDIDSYFVDLSYFAIELYLPRLLPLVVLAAGLCAQTVVLLPVFLYGRASVAAKLKAQSVPAIAAVFVAFLFLLYGTVAALHEHGGDAIGWNTIGGPILETQTAATFVLALFLLAAGMFLRGRLTGRGAATLGKHGDKVVFLLIWLAAALHWNALPLQPSWYLAAPQQPYADLAPNSDALVYDLTAQNMLAGEGLRSRAFDDLIVRRPLYTFAIGALYSLTGPGYLGVSTLQAVLLALFPAVVFLTGRDLHSRTAGIAAAALVIWREGNTIALSDQITVADSRLLMSDVPTALGVALFAWLCVRWLKKPDRAGPLALASGAALGGLILIRSETALLYPVVVLFLWIGLGRRIRPALPGSARLAAGVILLLTPWLVRNFVGTGQLFIEVPGNRLDFLINRFRGGALNPDMGAPPKAGLRPAEQVETGTPGTVWAHFLHSNLQSVLIFPTSVRAVDAAFGYTQHQIPDRFWETCCYRTNYIRRLPFWNWQKWDLTLPPETLVPVAASLLVLAVGPVGAHRRSGALALMPAVFGQVHFLANALARTSGGRYLVPVDWIWIFYYACGLVGIAGWVLRLVSRRPLRAALTQPPPAIRRPAEPARRWIAPAAVLLIGALLPLGEAAYPELYPVEPPTQWLQAALAQSAHPDEIQALTADPLSAVLHGRTLYPRYYGPGDGEQGETFRNLYPAATERVTLFIAGQTSSGVRLAVAGLPSFAAAHGEDVLVIGCRVNSNKGPYVEAALIYFPESGVLLEREGGVEDWTCPIR